MSVSDKVAYLSGLVDGLSFEKDSREGRVFDAIISVLKEIGSEIDGLRSDLADLEEFTKALDDDMSDLEGFLDEGNDEEEEEEEEDSTIDMECPVCGHINAIDPEVLWDTEGHLEILCSQCQAAIFSSEAFFRAEEED